MPLDCENLNGLPALLDRYWDVMPKSIRVNCSLEEITFPLTVYGADRNALEYRVLNPPIASVNGSGEVTLGRVRGVTMILAWKKGDPCDIRYVQVSVECPCDEYLPGSLGTTGVRRKPEGGGPEECDGAETITMIVSGFNGDCAGLNGSYVLVRAAPQVWVDGSGSVQVRRYAGHWRVEAGIGTPAFAEDYPAPLACAGDHPTGSGDIASAGCGQTGHYSIA